MLPGLALGPIGCQALTSQAAFRREALGNAQTSIIVDPSTFELQLRSTGMCFQRRLQLFCPRHCCESGSDLALMLLPESIHILPSPRNSDRVDSTSSLLIFQVTFVVA